jgi:hypothetical protein
LNLYVHPLSGTFANGIKTRFKPKEYKGLEGAKAFGTGFGHANRISAYSYNNYLFDGVTSAIQTQLNGKQGTITGAATTIDTENLTVSRALVSDANGKVAVSAVTSTELGYLDGVTSSIQTQLNGRSAKAWVNFNGTTSTGTIRSDYNVSSITKNGEGNYTVNFSTAMPDSNYTVLGTSSYTNSNTDGATNHNNFVSAYAANRSYANVFTLDANGGYQDAITISVAIFGN